MITGQSIYSKKKGKIPHAKFSILIPTWNNLDYLKLCISSIRKNSFFNHQIIVHINDGKDGTFDWVNEQPDIDFCYSGTNIGVCYALNYCRTLADTSYLLYLNDDMYVCPGWDKELNDEITAIGNPYFFLSSTAIEPQKNNNCSIIKDYGTDIHNFQEENLLREFEGLEMDNWSGSTWPPNIVHKDIWDMAGGYSTEFSPGMYSDPDFSMKLWNLGIRVFMGVGKSRVFHFGSKSVNRVKKNKGYYTFISKWGITSSTLTKLYLLRGEKYKGSLQEPVIPFGTKMKNMYKRINADFSRKGKRSLV
jgi:glycosyltransferase involved in cell wall biosynthesis